ncbi:cell fate regulator YaaT (PSP1 superfamily) [Breznakia sp. PF5-3]|uniref:regulatory iron-sulfur-containing complex subunit RicT n=1 Tax=unclassified Breznakia TaxID=2623764 RepID=UPI0024060647|nr:MULTISPECIES: regulatory iron-sulfur-containing complex subunit RicT [unclassified Breznakia]MDF9825100.1 cell fate regulator YaaT (PSP1 superfamily) [Breznakia sp. PM6-1]MDF9835923.1 cell fate regulator YaaT (PSP1 superfamily) [Breznakia sp. PF5-3]MDF9837475.1 cell fate regulator YaaT (PSP1 superfamily) [Breznakia sp. PFB2-8]MDF9859462.1 cell fate regulator YaaT (PSP1 superfamily) [Breznakia sp. PH5-24]
MSKNYNFTHVVSVSFDENGRTYTFGAESSDFANGEKVVVETVRGIEMATVCGDVIKIDDYHNNLELKPVLRKANKKDHQNYEQNIEKAKEAMKICDNEIKKIGLDMNLIEAEYTLDQSKVTFVYVSEERVDFRELLKSLATIFHCRIELRQIGPRNKAKMVGGIGQCGQECCCSRFMNDFSMVSINMAKNQMLALNIQKLSGQCGKLKCCLRFEDELYKEIKKDLPKINSRIEYNGKQYRITSYNVLMQQVKIENNEDVQFLEFRDLWPDMKYYD